MYENMEWWACCPAHFRDDGIYLAIMWLCVHFNETKIYESVSSKMANISPTLLIGDIIACVDFKEKFELRTSTFEL